MRREGAATWQQIKSPSMQIPRPPSRLFVTVSTSRCASQVLASFSQDLEFYAPLGVRWLRICVQKARNLQHRKK
jgi:hypothetical protein